MKSALAPDAEIDRHQTLLARYDGWINQKLGLPPLTDEEAARLRTAQAATFNHALPPVLISKILTGCAVAIISAYYGWFWFPIFWVATVISTGIIGIKRVQDRASIIRENAPSPKFVDRILIDSIVMALPWFVLGAVLNPEAAPKMAILTAAMLAALSCGGVFTMAIVPSSAISFGGIVFLGRFAQLFFMPLDEALSNMLFQSIYAAVLLLALRSMAHQFRKSVNLSAIADELRLSAQAHALSEERRREQVETRSCQFQKEIGTILCSVSQSVGEMSESARQLLQIAGRSQDNLQGALSKVGAATSDIHSVELCSHDLTATIALIRNEADHTTRLVKAAAMDVQTSIAIKEHLSETVRDIGQISSLIGEIAEQTNLLALNATIEAARAGPAGKGFAVVANEVKSLAARTGTATQDIARQIEEVRAATERSLGAVINISASTQAIIGATDGIVVAVDQQARAISTMVGLLARAVDDAKRASEAITQVGADADRTIGHGNDVSQAALGVDTASRRLEESVSRFASQVV